MAHQNDLDYLKDHMQQGRLSADEANVKLVRMEGVRLIQGRVPQHIRRVLNAAVRAGDLGHLKKEGLRPEAYYHPNARVRALDERDRVARQATNALIKAFVIGSPNPTRNT